MDSAICGAKGEEVDKVEVLEEEGVLDDMVNEEVVEEEDVVGVVEREDCWVEVATGVVVGVGVGVVMVGAEVGLGVSEFCAAEVCALLALVAAEVKATPGRLGLKRATKCMWLRLSNSRSAYMISIGFWPCFCKERKCKRMK